MFFPKNKLFAKLLKWQLVNKCFGRLKEGTIKFIVQGARMSGDMNTALGNCLLMSCMVYAFCKSVGIEKMRLANDGDDCVLIIERGDLWKTDTLPDWFLTMAFSMKVEDPVYQFEEIEFCQSKPVWTPEGYIMVRNPRAAIAKDVISTSCLPHVHVFKTWMKAVGMGGMALTGGIPIMQDFYARLLSLAGDVEERMTYDMEEQGFFRMGKGMNRQYGHIHWRTRLSFWIAFGIEPDRQKALELEVTTRRVSMYFKPIINRLKDFPL